ncbi:MAG: N-acetyltransferase [Syntrophus sp. (in: bacteria)]|nr:N-acetyltransferase [Syntrophus sp. (in: bacteria)]
MDPLEKVSLKPLTIKDLNAVVAIDYALLGKKRSAYWANKLEQASTSGIPSLAAEADGKLIGFILGKASGWEYAIPENIGWIDTIGVVKEWQEKGVSQLLFKEMYSMFKKVGVDTIYVFVEWRKWDLMKFFESMGFNRGNMVHLELKI